jgi:hypothetical protein
MTTQKPGKMSLMLLVLAMAGLAQWFFGNLYEAAVTAPNWRIPFEYEALTGISQDYERTIFYYVPLTQLALVCLWIATFRNWRRSGPARIWLGIGSFSGLCALLLTAYIVTQLNLQLFFDSGRPDMARVEGLMEIWQRLNYLRVVLVGITLVATANSLRLLYRTWLLAPQPNTGTVQQVLA